VLKNIVPSTTEKNQERGSEVSSQATMEKAPTEKAEELLDRTGRRIGLFAGQVNQRIQGVATSLRKNAGQGAARVGQPETAQETAQAGEPGQPATEKAEALVDRMGERVGTLAAVAGLQVMRITALLREGIEDMWAEAQNIRLQSRGKPH
jgi:hypothetical protein